MFLLATGILLTYLKSVWPSQVKNEANAAKVEEVRSDPVQDATEPALINEPLISEPALINEPLITEPSSKPQPRDDVKPVAVLTPVDSRSLAFESKREAYRQARIVPGVSPFSDFDKHRQSLAEAGLPRLRTLIEKEYGENPEVREFLTDIACYRFLRARDGNAEAAMIMIRATVTWRKKNNLFDGRPLCPVCSTKDPKSHAYFCIGYDYQDRAVMYSCSARAVDQKDVWGGIFHMVTEIEHAFDDSKGVAQIVWIVDFNGFTARHANPENGRQAAHLFQQVYPERLGQLVLLDFPWVFGIFYKIVSPLLDPVTRNKILILRTEQERRNYFVSTCPPELVDWMEEVQHLPPVPGLFQESKSIKSRYWK